MIRFGIHQREQSAPTPGPVARLLHGHHVSYLLLDVPIPAAARDMALSDNIVRFAV